MQAKKKHTHTHTHTHKFHKVSKYFVNSPHMTSFGIQHSKEWTEGEIEKSICKRRLEKKYKSWIYS